MGRTLETVKNRKEGPVQVDFPTPPSPALEDPNNEEYWRAQSDANTLKNAEAIKADESRSKAARYMLEKEASEREAALASLKK